MNGRIYDPHIARFVQADPFVQAPSDTQMLNRYSYVRNNPLNATDPSGFIKLREVFGTIIGIAVGAFTGCWECGAYIAGAINAAQTLHYGGSLGDALIAGVSSAALTYFGIKLFPGLGVGWGDLAKYGVQMGVIGGITSVLQGGKFGHGFISAGLGTAVGGPIGGKIGGVIGSRVAGRIIASVVVGGTISELTGGKFANGATTAAFASLFSEIAQGKQRADSGTTSGTDLSPEARQKVFDEALADVQQRGLVGDHEFEFVNEFATARIDSKGNIIQDSTVTYDNSAAAKQAASLSTDVSVINGSTTVGGNSSTIYAGATLTRSRVETFAGAFKPVNFTPAQNTRFVLLHEHQHGPLSVRSEYTANRAALRAMGRFGQ